MADLHCIGVGKGYGELAVLSGIDLTVPHGTLTAILGASGSGKTTLLRIIMGFVRPDSGRIVVGEQVVTDVPHTYMRPDARAIGYVAQEGALFPHLTVGENVGYGLPREQRKRSPRITEVLELVGMDATYEKRHVHEISGGEQRRVALARALAPRPQMILLDEPFSGLDAGLRMDTRKAVLAALREEKATTVLVTHDQAEALSMGKDVAVLRDGCLAQTASPFQLYWSPATLDVARFVGEAVVVPGKQSGSSVQCIFGTLRVTGTQSEGDVLVMIRPEQVVFGGSGGVATAVVTERVFFGPHATVQLSIEDAGHTYLVQSRTFSYETPATGEKVGVSIAGDVMTFEPGE